MKLSTALTILLMAICISGSSSAFAQAGAADSTNTNMEADTTMAAGRHHHGMHFNTMDDGRTLPTRKFYTSNGFDAALFQSAFLHRPGRSDEFTYLRFSYFVNLSADFNYDFDNNFGIFTGLGIKNIGFTQKESDSTIKRRVYTVGVPLGLKIGNLDKRRYLILGGGVDVPFNYREKGWTSRAHKTKMNEWFSDRTEAYMPYLFAGMSIKRAFSLKIQYYPGNFLNSDYVQSTDATTGVKTKPFSGWDTRLLFVSLGLEIRGKSKMSGGDRMEQQPE